MKKPIVLLDSHVYLPKRNVGFYLVPKAGATSIRRALGSVGEQAKSNLSELPAACRRIGVVRNTWDRIVSCWAQKTATQFPKNLAHLRDDRFSTGMSFEAFLAVVEKDPCRNHHFYPQNKIVPADSSVEIWELPKLSERWLAMFGKPLRIENNNPHRVTDYKTYYTAETQALVARIYAAEIERFGFVF